MRYSASALRERLEVLELAAVEGGWNWAPARETWAGVEVSDKSNLFSKVGVGARDATLVLRKQPITLHNAVRWRGEHLFLTSIVEGRPGWLDVRAARVEMTRCRAASVRNGMGVGNRPVRNVRDMGDFPGVLTEKYMGYRLGETHAETERTLVLVTPKPVSLEAGDLVTLLDGPMAGEVWNITAAHRLDLYKNEYEINRKEDV